MVLHAIAYPLRIGIEYLFNRNGSFLDSQQQSL
jgi:hypothetical protein